MKRLRITVDHRVYDVVVEVLEDDGMKVATTAPRPVAAPEPAPPVTPPSGATPPAPVPGPTADVPAVPAPMDVPPVPATVAVPPVPAPADVPLVPAPADEPPVPAPMDEPPVPAPAAPLSAAAVVPSAPSPKAAVRPPRRRSERKQVERRVVLAPVSGTVQNVFVEAGAVFDVESPVVLLDAMMMDTYVYAPTGGLVTEVGVAPGRIVQAGDWLIRYEG